MAKCDDCDGVVVWLKRSDGSWFPPVEPCLDLADGDYVLATVEGQVMAMPQVYKKHTCLTWEERQLRLAEKEAERQRLIAEDRARRQEAERIETERKEYERAQAQAARLEALRLRHDRSRARAREFARATFKPKRLLDTPCRDCGAEANEPCESLSQRKYWTSMSDDDERKWSREYGWFNTTPHSSRYEDGPAAVRWVRRAERWGDDYQGPWPPTKNDPGRYDMRTWLAENFTIFDPDGYQDRDWLLPREVMSMTSWLREHASILMNEPEPESDGANDCGRVQEASDG